jgi:uncharacterized protein (DUF58 family)
MVLSFYIWLMSDQARLSFVAGTVLVLALLCAGCISVNGGDALYRNRSIMVQITNTGEPADVTVQVTAYRIQDLHQQMYTIAEAPATIRTGETDVAVPVDLEPGAYKLYIYVISGGDRKTAVIRDITV